MSIPDLERSHSKHKRQDFASLLERAIQRSERAKLIEARAEPTA